jgi:oligopeptide transport system substrate-binding protein
LTLLRQRRSIALAILVVAFALVAASCSSGTDDTTTTTAAAADATTTTAGGGGDTTTTTTPPVEAPTDDTRLAGLTVVDDTTFTVELISADAEFPIQLAYPAYFPLPTAAYANTLGYNEAPIGNGPFMFPDGGSWDHDTAIDLVANPDYVGVNQPSIEGINFIITTDPKVDYLETLDGNIDVLTNIDVDFRPVAPTDFPDRFGESPNTGITYVGIPAYIDTFTKEQRQALSMSVDRDLLIEKIWGNGQAAHSVVPPNLGGRTDVCPSWNYDPETAKTLWESAPAPAGFSFWFNAGGGHEEWIEAVVNMWGNNLGMDTSTVTFETREWADYLPLVDDAQLDGPFRLGWGMDYPSPLNFLEPLYASYNTAPDGGSNATFYNNPEFDAHLAAGKALVAAEGTVEAGLAEYFAAEDLLCDDSQSIPLRFSENQFVWNEGIDNVFMNAFGNVDYGVITSGDGFVSQDLTEPQSLFPMNANESEGTQVLQANLFTGLVGFTADGGQYLGNATSITSDDGGTTWTVVLDPNYMFHNGEAVTASSYVDAWSLGANASLGFQNNSFYKNIVGYDELNAG